MRTRNIIIMLVILIALGGIYYITSRPEPPEREEPRIYVWMIEMEDIKHINIELPPEGKSESFIKIPAGDQFPWHFDDPQLSPIDAERWGGGIPLLLSGPGVDRIISENTTPEKLAEFGFTEPKMEITLTMEDGKMLNITIGDETPDGQNFYILAPNSVDVATVDISWFNEIKRLVDEPPYAPPPEED